jgi:hypothetical protein
MKYFALLALIFLPLLALAQATDTSFVPLTNIPVLFETGKAINTPEGLSLFLNTIYKISIGVAAVVAVLQIMRAGIMYMGSESGFAEKKEAKNLIALSIGGLILVLAPTIVFSIINPDILTLKIKGIDALKVEQRPIIVDTTTDQASAGYIQLKGEPLPPGKSCKDVLGPDWENAPPPALGSTAGSCSLLRPGDTCCGRLRQTPQEPVTPSEKVTFSTAEESVDYAKLGTPKCILYKTSSFDTLDQCQSAQLLAVSEKTVLIQNCNGSRPEINSATPVWKDIKDLPRCSQ